MIDNLRAVGGPLVALSSSKTEVLYRYTPVVARFSPTEGHQAGQGPSISEGVVRTTQRPSRRHSLDYFAQCLSNSFRRYSMKMAMPTVITGYIPVTSQCR